MDRVIDVLDFLTLKVIDVLNLLGHRCPGLYQITIKGMPAVLNLGQVN